VILSRLELILDSGQEIIMIKKLLAVAAFVALGTGSAFAADLAARPYTKAPVMAAPVFSWTGCYLGVHAGYGWGRNNNDFGSAVYDGDFLPELGPYNHTTSGGVAGGQVGCNYQFSGNWVVGVEGEAWWSGMRGGLTTPEDGADPGTYTRFESQNRWDADLAFRFGYAVNRSLFYGKAGVAVGNFNYIETHDDFPTTHGCPGGAPVCSVSYSNTRAGLLLGAGWEYAFVNNWTFKVEYNYIDFGSHTLPYPYVSAAIQSFPVSDRKQIVKLGVNYLFNAGPVVAKY
jgi:outer membrane immunogenic protein